MGANGPAIFSHCHLVAPTAVAYTVLNETWEVGSLHLHRRYEGREVRAFGQMCPPQGPGILLNDMENGDCLEEWRPDAHDVGREVIWRLMRAGVAVQVIRVPDET